MPDPTPTPYFETPPFDWEAYKDSTLNNATKDILIILGGSAERICYTGEKTQSEVNEIYNPVADLARDAMVKHNVGYKQATELFDYLRGIVTLLENKLKKEYEGHQKEVLSRLLGTKNPMTGKFDVDFATFEKLVAAVDKSRELTGGNIYDYFTKVDTPPTPTPEE